MGNLWPNAIEEIEILTPTATTIAWLDQATPLEEKRLWYDGWWEKILKKRGLFLPGTTLRIGWANWPNALHARIHRLKEVDGRVVDWI